MVATLPTGGTRREMGQDTVRSIQDLERSVRGAVHKRRSDTLPQTCDEEPPREFGLRILRDGTWTYLGSPIQRQALVKLFASVLRRGDDGRFWLVTPVERGIIHVEDAPFAAVDVDLAPPGELAVRGASLTFTTNLGETVVAGADHPIRIALDPQTGEPTPYILVRDGLEAMMTRAAYYRLVDMAVEREPGSPEMGVWSSGVFFRLGEAE